MTLGQRTNFGSAEYRKYIWKDNEVSFKRRKITSGRIPGRLHDGDSIYLLLKT